MASLQNACTFWACTGYITTGENKHPNQSTDHLLRLNKRHHFTHDMIHLRPCSAHLHTYIVLGVVSPCVEATKRSEARLKNWPSLPFNMGDRSEIQRMMAQQLPLCFTKLLARPSSTNILDGSSKAKHIRQKQHPIDGKRVKRDGEPSERMHPPDMYGTHN